LIKLEGKAQAKVYLKTQMAKLIKNIKKRESDVDIEERKILVNICFNFL